MDVVRWVFFKPFEPLLEFVRETVAVGGDNKVVESPESVRILVVLVPAADCCSAPGTGEPCLPIPNKPESPLPNIAAPDLVLLSGMLNIGDDPDVFLVKPEPGRLRAVAWSLMASNSFSALPSLAAVVVDDGFVPVAPPRRFSLLLPMSLPNAANPLIAPPSRFSRAPPLSST